MLLLDIVKFSLIVLGMLLLKYLSFNKEAHKHRFPYKYAFFKQSPLVWWIFNIIYILLIFIIFASGVSI
ncbi:hypothetical protein AM501_22970 [Aneurinibacillus migulanus]|uniref:Uncharacterized protein n=1 Tax=Aneurinibacillus migulanus TaxID=47500 RepID=A0A0D1VAX6_ANEMI|nr:hypothetical protein TS64_12750 [Aneurinibacillus migulanus]KIV56569.1 hypothetical protein TS65_12160 [Aneurinibacillus migulanus]KON95328.1 hypothetical protein AF333_07380 [Aneurinibacillus migulanus]KPD06100.1 hypothetical protein AM501_22970 [Aneurinibacillus migulanus]SDI66251.1 hypothetical protein SAMN04487909_10682 [Aneurinibacillus migulanus]